MDDPQPSTSGYKRPLAASTKCTASNNSSSDESDDEESRKKLRQYTSQQLHDKFGHSDYAASPKGYTNGHSSNGYRDTNSRRLLKKEIEKQTASTTRYPSVDYIASYQQRALLEPEEGNEEKIDNVVSYAQGKIELFTQQLAEHKRAEERGEIDINECAQIEYRMERENFLENVAPVCLAMIESCTDADQIMDDNMMELMLNIINSK